MEEIKEKPIQPLSQLVREGTIGDCPRCRSTQVKRYFSNTIFQFGKSIGCINPKCERYYIKI